MIEARFDEWQKNKTKLLQIIIEVLPPISDQNIAGRLEKIIDNFFVQSILLSNISGTSELLEDFNDFITNAKKAIYLWNRIEDPMQLLVMLSSENEALYEFDEPKDDFETRIRHSIYLARKSKEVLNKIGTQEGRPTHKAKDIFIMKLTQFCIELGLTIKLKSNAQKNKMKGNIYSIFMCKCMCVVGVCPSNPFKPCGNECSGLVDRIRRHLR